MINDESLHRRLTLLSVVLLAISGVLIVRLLSFQFRMNPDTKEVLESNAENRYSQTVEVMPDRGQIYDRNGNLLAVNSFNYRIGISPNQVLDVAQTARDLAPLVGLPEDDIYRRLQPDINGIYPRYVLLSSLVDFHTGQKIADLEIDGILIEPLPTRIYPQGALTAQVVGFFRGSDDSKYGRGYWGVEGYYQLLLAGQSKRVTKSNIPVLEESGSTVNRVRDGIDLVLTIDRDLQYLAQDVLDKAMTEHGATGGTILIMNPRTGEILAIANSPSFDPNDFSQENLLRAKNQAIADSYEPGSSFKVVTMAIAIENGIDPDTWTYYDPGCFEGGGVAICNWDRASHVDPVSKGNPTFAQVFIDSLNTGTATLYQQMGPRAVYPMLKEFGLGTTTGVDLEGEAAGILVEPGDPNWSEAQFLNTSYGQGISITPLQMLCALNAIANDGLIMQPHIVKARIDGDEIIETKPSASHRPISEKTAHKARDIMVRIVTNPNREDLLDFPGYSIAGKTGTAEIPAPYGYETNAAIASFVGFLPADDPVVSVLVKLDRPVGYWGSKTAAPVFQELVERLVVLMEIPPDDIRFQLEAQGGSPFEREY